MTELASPGRVIRGFEHVHRYFDELAKRWTVQVLPGEHYITTEDEIIATVLGSCVSVCIRDTQLRVGGINHFMLPGVSASPESGARYGQVALERLINDLIKQGARRERFEIKLFGGGRVIGGKLDIGQTNIDFVLRYLEVEELPVLSQSLGGAVARRIRYYPWSGRTRVKEMEMKHGVRAEQAVESRRQRVSVDVPDIELF